MHAVNAVCFPASPLKLIKASILAWTGRQVDIALNIAQSSERISSVSCSKCLLDNWALKIKRSVTAF